MNKLLTALSGALCCATAFAQGVPPHAPGLPPGLYVQVLEGLINVSNKGGTTSFAAGQFGFTPSIRMPPVIMPTNPGMQFTPPPAFSSSGSSTPLVAGGSKAVDCEVR